MRTLEINETKLWYSLYTDSEPILDDNGDETGQYGTSYSDPVSFNAYLSAARGNAQDDVFGKELDYTKSMITCEELEINEYSLIFISEPELEEGETLKQNMADYSVVQVAKSINSTAYALRVVSKNRG